MALRLDIMFKDKAGRVNVLEDNERFMTAFLNATHEVLAELKRSAHVTPTFVTSPEQDTGLDEQYIPVLSAGIDHFLTQRSEFNVDDPAALQKTWLLQLSKAPSIYFKDNTVTSRYGNLN